MDNFDVSLSQYRDAIAQWPASPPASQPTTGINAAQTLDLLQARDAVQVALEDREQTSPSGIQLMELARLDEHLRQTQALFFQVPNFKLPDWRSRLNPPEHHWWWYFEPPKSYPKLFDQDWVWTGVTVTALTISTGLMLNTIARLGIAGTAATGGAIAIAAQSIITLITTKSALSEAGQTGLKQFLKQRKVPEHYWHELGASGAWVALLAVGSIHAALPWLGGHYGRSGYANYQQNQLSRAQSHYQLALDLRPDDPLIQYRLGILHEDLNELPNRSKLRGITSLRLTHFVAQLSSTAPSQML